jgi:hypothetical protein
VGRWQGLFKLYSIERYGWQTKWKVKHYIEQGFPRLRSKLNFLYSYFLREYFHEIYVVRLNYVSGLTHSKRNMSWWLIRLWNVEALTFSSQWAHRWWMRLSALRTDRPHFTLRNITGTHFCWTLSRPRGYNPANWNLNDMGDRNRNFPACSIAPQPTTLLRASLCHG